MNYAIVRGTVVASQKVSDLVGQAFKILQPCDGERRPFGDAVVAVDPIGAREGDFVIWVGKREASLAIPGSALANNYPVDAAVTGIIDDLG